MGIKTIPMANINNNKTVFVTFSNTTLATAVTAANTALALLTTVSVTGTGVIFDGTNYVVWASYQVMIPNS